jgi:hypothetical protein
MIADAGPGASASDAVTKVAVVAAVTATAVAVNVPLIGEVTARRSVAAAKAAERRNDGRYDMVGLR